MSRTQEQTYQSSCKIYAGIDVGKSNLDLCIHPLNVKLRVRNDKAGIRKLAQYGLRHGVGLIALEATGSYHRRVHEMLHEAGLKTAVINPFRSRQFAESLGQLAKTDTIDAKTLARFAEMIQPSPTIPPSQAVKALRALNTARRQVVEEIGDLKRQLKSTEHLLAARQIRARIKMAERHKSILEEEARTLIQVEPDMRDKFNILTSIPNVEAITATTLICDLNELGEVNCKQIAALVGVAPMNWDSGSKHGNRMIRGGRKSVRNALYMCAVSATSRAGPLGQFYRKLIRLGKHPKVALTAVIRKLAILANTLIAENRCWEPERP